MSRRPVSDRACAAALLAAGARRRSRGLPRIVLPRLAAAGDGVGGGGGAGSAQGLDAAISEPGVLELDDDPAEGVLFLAAPGEPDVVLAHLLPRAGGECLAALADELLSAGQLGGQLGQERGVGGELVAGQAGVSLAAVLAGRGAAPTLWQDPVRALVG